MLIALRLVCICGHCAWDWADLRRGGRIEGWRWRACTRLKKEYLETHAQDVEVLHVIAESLSVEKGDSAINYARRRGGTEREGNHPS
jgi:hypothetical protein